MQDNIAYFMNSSMGLIASGGYWILSVIVILEGLPLLGSFFPGHFVIIFAGFLAKVGILKLWLVILVTIISSTLADGLGYYLGKKYGYAHLQKFGKYIFIKELHIERIRRTIETHSGKAIFFSKFTPVTRSLTPFLAGASGVNSRIFWIYSILGGIVWVVLSVMLGYVFGAGYHIAAEYLGRFIVIALIVSVLIIWAYRFVNLRFHVFKKYELIALGLNLFSLWALAKTVEDSLSLNSFMVNFDIWVNNLMQGFTSAVHSASAIANFITVVGGMTVLITLGLLISAGFIIKKKWRRALIMIFSILLTAGSVNFMKEIFMRVRPTNALHMLLDPSFPSGHAALSAAFFVAFAYIFIPHIHSWKKREIFIVFCVFSAFLIGLSRVVLSVHWASDVITGWSLGVFIATGSILVVRYIGAIFIRPTTGKLSQENPL